MQDTRQPQQQQDEAATGKRIYLGNLLYSVKPATISDMLHEGGFDNFEKLHISIDPVSGRNPGYCFVDFPDKASADRALHTLDVSIGGRPLKVRPCEPRKPRASTTSSSVGRGGGSGSGSGNDYNNSNNNNNNRNFNRWGDWNSSRDRHTNGSGNGNTGSSSSSSSNNNNSNNNRHSEQGPNAALNHFDDNLHQDGRRLYVGGLGKMIDQDHNRIEMESIFADFNIAAIGKRITARHDDTRSSTDTTTANRNFCFIDFHSREEAEAARRARDGIELNGSPITVRTARRQREQPSSFRHEVRAAGAGAGAGGDSSVAATDSPSRAFASRDWRRRVD